MPDPHLLLVDDSPDVRTIVAHLCKRAGFRLDACPGVAPAWEFLQQTRPALVLLDVQMPPVSGVELCRLIRAAGEPLRSTPVALFTHWGVPDDVLAGLEAGADFVVSKDLLSAPVQWQQRVSEIFRLSSSPRENPLLSYVDGAVDTAPAPPTNWMDVLNLALHREMVRRVGFEVARLVVRRALRRTAAARPEALHGAAASGPAEAFPPDWGAVVRGPAAVVPLAAALADEMVRLLGAEESAPFRAALAPLLPGYEDSQAP